MENNLHSPLTEPQLDLLKMFSHKVDDADWVAIKRMIVHYFAQKAIEGADQVWDEQNWDDQKVDEILNTHLRTPYKPARY
ncbi:hypothetical protein GO755_13600 [Spirosoma sp. HMF4905]|uniref:Uncharacterized protein n=1 Tax=Spirosoma arboris TaxID=2682092 RepID=A0A7K1SBA9_9BACT|nr:hypothetical protein [Spirosoma arboris]MVM31070.1 hypothetical protein [Spirosoma arboris]